MKIHILGISGTFMSGIAILAKQKGHSVTGSDNAYYDPIKSVLEGYNIPVSIGYKVKDLKNKDLIIIGNIMSRGHAIVEYILKNNIDHTSGPQWLHDNILKNKKVIAISGTHGKTTTTSMVVHIMNKCKLNPSYLIGGDPIGTLKTAKLTSSEFFVIEADEYDTAFFDKRSKFIHYKPHILMINNIEYDHADIFKDMSDILKTFHHLIRIVPPNGKIIINKNDGNTKKLLKKGCWSKLVSIDGIKNSGDYNLNKKDGYFISSSKKIFPLPNNIIGYHNYLNMTSAIAICNQIGIPIKRQIKTISSFKGVRKRLEYIGKISNKLVYEDFAHHPTAIKYAINSIKEKYKNKKLFTILIPGSNTMQLGIHDDKLYASLKRSNKVLIISKYSSFKKLKINNTKINVIESESQIGQYLHSDAKFDVILILSNKNTKEVRKYI